jgi:thiol-disulfide isomerase/thioredoxin
MKIHFVIVLLLLINFLHVFSQADKLFNVVTFEQLEPRLNLHNDTIYIVNFWATWCISCRKELPEFEKIQKVFENSKVKMLLVSLDFINQQEALKSFIEKNKITPEVLILNAPDANKWIDKVDPNWSGSIPATLIYKDKVRKFYEGELDFKTIESQINSLSNP